MVDSATRRWQPSAAPIIEDDPLTPETGYALAKGLCEQMGRCFHTVCPRRRSSSVMAASMLRPCARNSSMGALSSSLLENSRCVAGSRMLRATPSPTGEEMYSSEYTPASVLSEFNKRFNAYAPSWESDLQHGHSLADYPGVIERLQALWAAPAKAMEVLEKSLTRPDSSTDTFELPAYRELLFLYAVARDLSERDASPAKGDVDLLLPVVDMGGVASTSDSSAPETVNAGLPIIEPLMATRPIKAQPDILPSFDLDQQLDDIAEPAEAHKP